MTNTRIRDVAFSLGDRPISKPDLHSPSVHSTRVRCLRFSAIRFVAIFALEYQSDELKHVDNISKRASVSYCWRRASRRPESGRFIYCKTNVRKHASERGEYLLDLLQARNDAIARMNVTCIRVQDFRKRNADGLDMYEVRPGSKFRLQFLSRRRCYRNYGCLRVISLTRREKS